MLNLDCIRHFNTFHGTIRTSMAHCLAIIPVDCWMFFFHPINSYQVRKHCRDRLVAADSSLSRTLVRFAVAAVALGTLTIYY